MKKGDGPYRDDVEFHIGDVVRPWWDHSNCTWTVVNLSPSSGQGVEIERNHSRATVDLTEIKHLPRRKDG